MSASCSLNMQERWNQLHDLLRIFCTCVQRGAGTWHALLRDLIDLWEAVAVFTVARGLVTGPSRTQDLSKLAQAVAFRQVPYTRLTLPQCLVFVIFLVTSKQTSGNMFEIRKIISTFSFFSKFFFHFSRRLKLYNQTLLPSYTTRHYDQASQPDTTTKLHNQTLRPSYTTRHYDQATQPDTTTKLHNQTLRPSYTKTLRPSYTTRHYYQATQPDTTTKLHNQILLPSYTTRHYYQATQPDTTTKLHNQILLPSYTTRYYYQAHWILRNKYIKT
jgi:hypothetical protein